MFSNGVRKETRALANVASRVGYSASRPVAELVSHSSLEQVHSSLGVIETQSVMSMAAARRYTNVACRRRLRGGDTVLGHISSR